MPAIPLFPLGTVLLPGAPLSLHIFEPRYRRLLADVQEKDNAFQLTGAFGVVLLRRGTETGSTEPDAVAEVGTLAQIMEVERYPDGRADVLAVGSRRFQLLEVDTGRAPYWVGDVRWLDEADGAVDPSDSSAARTLTELYAQALCALTGRDADEEDLPADSMQLSYEIPARLPLSAADRQQLLACATTGDRLRSALRMVRRETVLLRRTRTVPVPPDLVRIRPEPN